MNVYVNTSKYEMSHGKAPGGFGSWAFDLTDAGGSPPVRRWEHQATYGRAKAAAVKAAREIGALTVIVLP